MGNILTAVDEPVVVLLVGLVAVSRALKVDNGDALGAAARVVVDHDGAEGANSGGEELLKSRSVAARSSDVYRHEPSQRLRSRQGGGLKR